MQRPPRRCTRLSLGGRTEEPHGRHHRPVEIQGGPHVMCVTHAEEVNRELLAFLRENAPVAAVA
jgi:hypothetical protein